MFVQGQQEEVATAAPAKKKREKSTTSHLIAGDRYILPSSRIPITKNLYKELLANRLGDGEIAVTESQFNEYERLRLERLNSLGNSMSPAHGALINELHNRLIISLTDKADLIGQVNDLKRENVMLKNLVPNSLIRKYSNQREND